MTITMETNNIPVRVKMYGVNLMVDKIFPFGNKKIDSPVELGEIIRGKRRADSLTQAEAAALCGVGTRFLSELEKGKPGTELGKVLQVLQGLGLDFYIAGRGWNKG